MEGVDCSLPLDGYRRICRNGRGTVFLFLHCVLPLSFLSLSLVLRLTFLPFGRPLFPLFFVPVHSLAYAFLLVVVPSLFFSGLVLASSLLAGFSRHVSGFDEWQCDELVLSEIALPVSHCG